VSAWGQSLKDWLQAGTYAAAILAAVFSLWQYRRNSLRERTRWLFELYQRFYGQPALRAMRMRLDLGETNFLGEAGDKDLAADLDDFLNFFELVAFLERRRELKRDEVEALFAYPLQTIGKNPDVVRYVREYDYGELDRLLRELGHAS
jgi:hypothetical protein